MKTINENIVLQGYLASALWTEELKKKYAIKDIDTESIIKAKKDISTFLQNVKFRNAEKELETYDRDDMIGHNLWLSRNGHGSGFFDDDCNLLQDIAREMPMNNVYDENKVVYIESYYSAE